MWEGLLWEDLRAWGVGFLAQIKTEKGPGGDSGLIPARKPGHSGISRKLSGLSPWDPARSGRGAELEASSPLPAS